MTIYTTEVKKKDADDVPEVKAVLIVDAEKGDVAAAPAPPRLRRRSSFCTTCLVCVLACLMVAGGVIGGMFLFKHFTRGRFIGRCGVNYKNHDLMMDDAIAMPQYDSYTFSPGYDMDEDVEIDSSELTETITVPSFDDNHPATILHDFTNKLSAYKDLQERFCYVMELNTSAILPPRNFIDLLLKVRDGSYIPKADVVKRTMVVLEPEVKDLDQFGPFISYLCSDVPTYRLVKITDLIGGGLIEKRSVDGKYDLVSKDELICKTTSNFGHFSGKFLIEDSVCWLAK